MKDKLVLQFIIDMGDIKFVEWSLTDFVNSEKVIVDNIKKVITIGSIIIHNYRILIVIILWLIWFLFALRNRKILNKLLIKGLAYVFIVFFMLLISILVWFDYNKIDTQIINDWAEFKLISNTCEEDIWYSNKVDVSKITIDNVEWLLGKFRIELGEITTN